MTETTFDAGRVFFRPGDPAERAYLLTEGHVELLAGGSRVTTFGPGDVFGEMSLIEERPHRMTAKAVTPGRCSALTRAEFEDSLVTDPTRARQYLRSLFERLRDLASQAASGGVLQPARQASVTEPVAFPTDDPSAAPLPVRVVLFPLTAQAAKTLPAEGLLATKLPFRIGRAPGAEEKDDLALNDVWLIDQRPYNVSRNHCAIDRDDAGRIVVRDRGSHLGCQVNDKSIGGRSTEQSALLRTGDNVLVLGNDTSPFQFRVTVGPNT